MHGRLVTATAVLLLALAAPASAVTLYGTDGTTLHTFDSAAPATVTSTAITGLGGDTLVALEADPRTGRLHGASTDTLFEIAPASGAATNPRALGLTLTGNAFGAAFDRASGSLRIVSDTAGNWTVDVATGAATAGNALVRNGVAALGATNSFAGATSSALYGVVAGLGELVTVDGQTGAMSVGAPFGVPALLMTLGFTVAGEDAAYLTVPRAGDTDLLHPMDLDTATAGAGAPIGAAATNIASLTAAPPSVARFARTTASAEEGETVALTVARPGPTAGPQTVDWTGGGMSGQVSWLPGDAGDRAIVITLPEDAADEPDETFTVTLSSPDGRIVAPATATVTIVDDDAPALPPAPTPTTPAPVTPPPVVTTPVRPPAVTPPRSTPPKLTVARLAGRMRDLTTSRGLAVRVTSTKACRLTAELRISRATAKRLKLGQRIARSLTSLEARKAKTVRLTPMLPVRRKLRSLRSVRATVLVTCADGRGDANPPTERATTLRR